MADATKGKLPPELTAALESVSDKDAEEGLKAAFRYFAGEEVKPDEMTAGAIAVFNVLQPVFAASKRKAGNG